MVSYESTVLINERKSRNTLNYGERRLLITYCVLQAASMIWNCAKGMSCVLTVSDIAENWGNEAESYFVDHRLSARFKTYGSWN